MNVTLFFKHTVQSNLAYLSRVENALLKNKSNDPDVFLFWNGLVRDNDGSWEQLRVAGIRYFQYGIQNHLDLTNEEQRMYCLCTVQQEKKFLVGLIEGRFQDMKEWIIELHKIQSYKREGGKLLAQHLASTSEHTKVVQMVILPLARKYHDPYSPTQTQVTYLSHITKEGLPMDEWVNPNEVIHHYPNRKYVYQYLVCMRDVLQSFILKIGQENDQELLKIIAIYYQYAINTHMFEYVNQSLFFSHVNALLRITGFNPIAQGIMDFAAMRLQPKNFINFFIDEVLN